MGVELLPPSALAAAPRDRLPSHSWHTYSGTYSGARRSRSTGHEGRSPDLDASAKECMVSVSGPHPCNGCGLASGLHYEIA